MEAAGVHPRRHHNGLLSQKAVVAAVLLLRLLLGAGDHQFRLGEGALLRINALADRVAVLDLIVGHARCQQAALLLAAEGMAREHQRNPRALRHQRPHVTGVGVVGMNPVGTALLSREMGHQRIGQLIEVGPEQLLTQITAGAEGKAQDAGTVAELLPRLAVIG